MNLHDYFNSPGCLTVTQLAKEIGITNVAQVRQWQHGYADRVPSPENCVAIERATGRRVMRWDLRPEDWHRIWPELKKVKGAPKVPPALATSAQAAIETIAQQ